MHLDPLHGFHPSCEARCIFAYLHRRGGSVRLGPLLRGLAIVWRKAVTDLADEERRPLTDIYRLCTTRFGRRKYRASWPMD